jgi:hypothetical protein
MGSRKPVLPFQQSCWDSRMASGAGDGVSVRLEPAPASPGAVSHPDTHLDVDRISKPRVCDQPRNAGRLCSWGAKSRLIAFPQPAARCIIPWDGPGSPGAVTLSQSQPISHGELLGAGRRDCVSLLDTYVEPGSHSCHRLYGRLQLMPDTEMHFDSAHTSEAASLLLGVKDVEL